MTAARGSQPRHLTIVADTTPDNRHLPPSQPVHRGHAGPDPDPPLRARTRTARPAVDHRISGRAQRWSFRHWAVAFTVLAQLAIGAAISAGGDPTIGIAAALIMALCGAALITAESTTNQSTSEAETAPISAEPQPADSQLNEDTDS